MSMFVQTSCVCLRWILLVIWLAPGYADFPRYQCNFDDNDTCGFVQSTDDEMDFTLNQGETETVATGPSSDASGSGYYIYLEVTPKLIPTGAKAIIVSPAGAMDATQTYQLAFMYHMFGDDIGTLDVIAMATTDVTSGTVEWTETGAVGSSWMPVMATLPANTIHVAFRASKGNGSPSDADYIPFTGDICIDEVVLTVADINNCLPDPCFNGGVCTAAGSTFTCACTADYYNHDCSIKAVFGCNFEANSLCDMVQPSAGDLIWTVGSGPTHSSNTGPLKAADNIGRYVYIDTSPNSVNPGDTVTLIINPSVLPTLVATALSFIYHMHGETIGTLDVLYMDAVDATDGTVLWTQTGPVDESWHAASLTIPAGVAFVGFRASKGGSSKDDYTGDIAIDDIILQALIDKCDPDPCKNGGVCTTEADTDECASSPCKNGGTCIDKVDDFGCVCRTGFFGKDCRTENLVAAVLSVVGFVVLENIALAAYLSWKSNKAAEVAAKVSAQGQSGAVFGAYNTSGNLLNLRQPDVYWRDSHMAYQ